MTLIQTDFYKITHMKPKLKFEPDIVGSMRHFNIPYFNYVYPFHSCYRSNRNLVKNLFDFFINYAENEIKMAPAINLVCRGSSGCFVASIFYELFLTKKRFWKNGLSKDVRIVLIRKEDETSHSLNNISGESNKEDSLWVFVDDFVDDGETIEKSFKRLKNYHFSKQDWKFDWVVCNNSRISGFRKLENYTNNLICNFDKF
jgi:hypothetical protein